VCVLLGLAEVDSRESQQRNRPRNYSRSDARKILVFFLCTVSAFLARDSSEARLLIVRLDPVMAVRSCPLLRPLLPSCAPLPARAESSARQRPLRR